MRLRVVSEAGPEVPGSEVRVVQAGYAAALTQVMLPPSIVTTSPII